MNSILGTKKGMTQVFDEAGNVVPVTVIEAGPCVVTQLRTVENDGYGSIQVGFGKVKKLNKPLKGHLKELNQKHLREFRVEKPEEYKVGQEIKVEIFKPGEIVNVSGISVGKGFAGTVKRFHHGRGPMTHGSKSHRIPGSIGAGTTPGRVYKGRGMPGRMGAEKATVKNLKVVKVDSEKNILLLAGTVPGKRGNLLVIKGK
ncbi:50S ribosomal protein L3 [candidate division WOR-1 bacterium DG_54_3]|jgi:large subunit ribosomal protein L3|uniref:Large ribosomal subunit protein uL3 n=1 Tax=candidate division WOR-1 bacterium DG_54_3 TaxID=1703775 RepID=A0A0S7Y2R0_UNCSA|nr:MAG: 50S ribosomal protein L3 [candidate division WOR-1 bacterium DG_54_3]